MKLEEPRSYTEIFLDSYFQYVLLFSGLFFGLGTVLTGLVAIHAFGFEIGFVAEVDAAADSGISDNPNWMYLVNFLAMLTLSTVALWEYRRARS